MEAAFSIAKNNGDEENMHSNSDITTIAATTAVATTAAAKCHTNYEYS